MKEIQVRIGIHTGLVVAGEMGAGERREALAIVGETPNLAARLQALAEPNTIVISAATYRLVRGYITCRSLVVPMQTLAVVSHPRGCVRSSGREQRSTVVLNLPSLTGLTPLVGRAEEIGLLEKRWERVKEGEGAGSIAPVVKPASASLA